MLRQLYRVKRVPGFAVCKTKSTFETSVRPFSNRNNSKDTFQQSSLDLLLKCKTSEDDEDNDDFEGRPENIFDENVDGEPDPRQRLGKLLLSMGKVHYRHAELLPDWFIQKQNEICSYRTKAQIRRCLKDWMVKYDREASNKFRLKPLAWGDKARADNKAQPLNAYGPEETVAYSFYFMPSRYSIAKRLFEELSLLAPKFSPKRVIDFGCGPGTAAAAVHDVWESGTTGAQKYTGIDISQAMIDAAKIMTANTIPDCTFYSTSGEVVQRAENKGERYDLAIASFVLSELPDDPSRRIATQMMFEMLDVGGYLVIIEPGNPRGSHTVRTARQYTLDTFNSVDNTGKSLTVASTFYKDKIDSKDDSKYDEEEEDGEDGWGNLNRKDNNNNNSQSTKYRKERPNKQDDNTILTQIRMLLPPPPPLHKQEQSFSSSRNSAAAATTTTRGYNFEELGAFVIAPCSHDRACPIGNGAWCSFSQKVYSGMIRKASEEKFSYVVIQKRPKLQRNNLSSTATATAASSSNSNGRYKSAAAAANDEEKEMLQMIGDQLEGIAPPTPPSSSTVAAEAEAVVTGDPVNPKSNSIDRKSKKSNSILSVAPIVPANHWGKWTEQAHYHHNHKNNSTSSNSSGGEEEEEDVDTLTPLEILERFIDVPKDNIPELVDNLLDEVDFEDYQPPLHREEWARIVRSPIKAKGHVIMDLCTPEGSLIRSTLSRSNMLHVPSLFTALRKTTWGGLFPVLAEEVQRSPLTKTAKGVKTSSYFQSTPKLSEKDNYMSNYDDGERRKTERNANKYTTTTSHVDSDISRRREDSTDRRKGRLHHHHRGEEYDDDEDSAEVARRLQLQMENRRSRNGLLLNQQRGEESREIRSHVNKAKNQVRETMRDAMWNISSSSSNSSNNITKKSDDILTIKPPTPSSGRARSSLAKLALLKKIRQQQLEKHHNDE